MKERGLGGRDVILLYDDESMMMINLFIIKIQGSIQYVKKLQEESFRSYNKRKCLHA